MLIVLEGCDGSGKTTLANKLSMMLGAEIIHCTTDTPNTYMFFKSIIEMAQTKNIIADRFCYGQFVYQEPEDRKLTSAALYDLELSMLNTGARVIYVDATTAAITDRLANRNETTLKSVDTIRVGYDRLWNKSILPITVAYSTADSSGAYDIFRVDKEYSTNKGV